MTVYQVSPDQELNHFAAGYFVRAEELRDLLFEWEKRLLPLSGAVVARLREIICAERLSLHCEPDMKAVASYQGKPLHDMSRDELLVVAEELGGQVRRHHAMEHPEL